jgi:DNA-binding PucR family transcriptional regulator
MKPFDYKAELPAINEAQKKAAIEYRAERERREAANRRPHSAEVRSMHTGARLDSATAGTDSAAKPERKAQRKPELETTRASKFSVRAIRWFWPGRFALGKLGLVGPTR